MNMASLTFIAYFFFGICNKYLTILPYIGLIRQPKWGHLRELHATIKACSKTLLFGKQKNFSLGQSQEVNLLILPFLFRIFSYISNLNKFLLRPMFLKKKEEQVVLHF